MDTEETEGCALQRRPYSVRSRNCVMFGITGTRGGEIPEKKKKKTADISRRHDWYSREVTSKELQQKFHTDDISLPKNASEWS